MNLLLDTHIVFWLANDSPQLSASHRRLLTGDGKKYVSAVSGWEIANKVRLGKWPEAAKMLPDIAALIERMGLEALPLTLAQAERAGAFAASHKDPFDRLLAAQALDLGLTIVTVDPVLQQFGCNLV